MHCRTCYVALFFILAIKTVFAQKEMSTVSKREIENWYTQMEWPGKTTLTADSSIDKEKLYVQYHKYPERWKLAFDFLKKGDLEALEVGDHELDGKTVFIKVSAYDTKDQDSAYYELHHHYSDIHYVISGKEYIDARDRQELHLKTPYDAQRDIEFYSDSKPRYHLAYPGNFLIFFPGSLHRPGIRVDNSIPVKKLVIKVQYDE